MPRFLTLFTADQLTPPTPEHIERMGKYMEQQARAGRLIATGGLKQRARDGLTVPAMATATRSKMAARSGPRPPATPYSKRPRARR